VGRLEFSEVQLGLVKISSNLLGRACQKYKKNDKEKIINITLHKKSESST
jgi:hypothetical protein